VKRRYLTLTIAVLALTGCSTTTGSFLEEGESDDLVSSTVDPATPPGFLARAQADRDGVTDCRLGGGLDGATTRFQARWKGQDIYLGVIGRSTVSVISVTPGPDPTCGSGSSIGNTVIGLGDPTDLQYLPQGTAHVPTGWRALTDWVIVRD
jgi:hypothetical protein